MTSSNLFQLLIATLEIDHVDGELDYIWHMLSFLRIITREDQSCRQLG